MTMLSSLRIIYVGLFLVLLAVLGIWSQHAFLDFSVPHGTTFLDGKWAKAVETRYDEDFPLKRLGINLWAAVDYVLFKEGRPGVVIGRDGWLFSDEEFKPPPGAEKNIGENLCLIGGVQRFLSGRGIRLVLAIVPSKFRLYRENLEERKPVRLHRGLYRRFHLAADAEGITAPDLLASLAREKNSAALFLRTDTHWTPFGARIAAESIAHTVRRHGLLNTGQQRFVTDAAGAERHRGDLLRFLPLDPLFAQWLPPPDELHKRSTRVADEVSGGEALFADVLLPVALVGTSYSANPNWNFAGALRQALGADLASHAEDGQGPLLPMFRFLQSNEFKNAPPELVVWEFPERYLPAPVDSSQFDAQWLERPEASAIAGEHRAICAINADSPYGDM
jgi:alginate O-acetyltransferase complex protein AlgJ